DALKLWMTLRVIGADGIGELLDRAIEATARIGDLVASDPRMNLLRRPALSTVLFRPRPPGCDDDETDALVRPVRDALFAEARAPGCATSSPPPPRCSFSAAPHWPRSCPAPVHRAATTTRPMRSSDPSGTHCSPRGTPSWPRPSSTDARASSSPSSTPTCTPR